MPRAEAGTTKALSNKLKSKGLQRLRWYCQVCERQMRDENGFKCHTQSESHVRQMLLVGEDPRKYISDFSAQFQRDFLLQLRTSHGEKKIMMNHFYQEYIGNKEHVHMNSTRWPSLTEFAKHLGREGLCRVEEGEKGLQIAWIDNSPEALRRQNALRKKERQDRGDEEREQKQINEQIARAKANARLKANRTEDSNQAENGETDSKPIDLQEVKSINLNIFKKPPPAAEPSKKSPDTERSQSPTQNATTESEVADVSETTQNDVKPISLGLNKPKNVFASMSKKNPLSSKHRNREDKSAKRPMSEAERIMREEIEKKKLKDSSRLSGHAPKRQRVQ